MKQSSSAKTEPLCPSAQPTMTESVVFGIVAGTVEQPQLTHLVKPQPVTEELLALAHPVNPTEIFRFAAPCAKSACQHFDGSQCRLATRIVEGLPAVVEQLPPCPIRASCRWWQQEGKAACMRCPQIATETFSPSKQLLQASDPAVY
jgi:hypothetical protein